MDAAPKTDSTRSVAPFAVAMAVGCLAIMGLCAAFAPADSKDLILIGAIASSVAGAIALAALWFGVKHGTNGLLGGFGVGFLARALAVAIGLLASRAQGRQALIYVASFFGFYALTQAVEIAYVWASSRSARAHSMTERSTP